MRRHSVKTLDDLAKVKQVTTFEELRVSVVPVLRHLGPHLSCDVVLMVKLNRLARAFMHKVGKQTPRQGAVRKLVYPFRTDDKKGKEVTIDQDAGA